MSIIDNFVNAAIAIADDNSHGYSNVNNQGPDYDCGMLISKAAQQVGLFPAGQYYEPIGSGRNFSLYNEKVLLNNGFNKLNYPGLQNIKKGDVLVSGGHTVLSIDNGKHFVHAAQDLDGRTGDSSGKEICVCDAYDNGNWLFVYRYADKEEVETVKIDTEFEIISIGSNSDQVKNLQALLNAWLPYVPALVLDGFCGEITEEHIKMYQRLQGLTVDGICGKETWTDICS